MNHKKTYSLAALAAAAFLSVGMLAVLWAQQPAAEKAPAAGATTKSVPAAPQGAANNAAGANFFGGPPGAQPRAWASGGGAPMMMPTGSAADDDPEMAELAQTEATLAAESADILARFGETDNAADRKKASAELRESLAKQFDVQRKRRELELGRIEEQVRKLRDQLKKRTDARETIIDRRLDQLVNEVEGLGWTPPAGATGTTRSPYSGVGRGTFGSTPNRSAAAK
jgi:hypothetical protein